MRFVPIVLLLGIIANFVVVIVFRLKLDRDYEKRFLNYSEQLHSQVISFSSNVLFRVDSFLQSNSYSRVSRSVSSNYNPSLSSSLFDERGSWDYVFYISDGVCFARVGILDFRVGDRFPRGGRITGIFPDCVVVDNEYVFNNSSYVVANSGFNSIPGNVHESSNPEHIRRSKNVNRVNSVRK